MKKAGDQFAVVASVVLILLVMFTLVAFINGAFASTNESLSDIIKEESEDYEQYKEKTKWWDEEEDEKEHECESDEWNEDDKQEEKAMERARD
ncbi:MAG: hypothetical protein K0S93_84 [Nitrososphaeraceae archaeon]|jgi:predicted PurR-regulated permease PerM|nr:hypothetical protein [Nitrososphaeraceae archaeon]